jgi:hypothetical protein
MAISLLQSNYQLPTFLLLPLTDLVPLTVLKLARNANNAGRFNCLRQPGHIRNHPKVY